MDPEGVVQRGEVTCSESHSKEQATKLVGFLTLAGFIGVYSLLSEPGLYQGREGAQDSTILP